MYLAAQKQHYLHYAVIDPDWDGELDFEADIVAARVRETGELPTLWHAALYQSSVGDGDAEHLANAYRVVNFQTQAERRQQERSIQQSVAADVIAASIAETARAAERERHRLRRYSSMSHLDFEGTTYQKLCGMVGEIKYGYRHDRAHAVAAWNALLNFGIVL